MSAVNKSEKAHYKGRFTGGQMDGWGVMPNIKESQNKVTSCHNLEGGKAASKGKIDGCIKRRHWKALHGGNHGSDWRSRRQIKWP